ncbi:srg family chemoreceptor domain-containing protein [Ditylenchus destructor]|uniref:Serpentine receptor class gamma n=1 Tax=Ditylenchus destructor TaxID=166010 RepID=A0AAD4R3B9_9BILA|nr:srg family chemoreceptor domain-containing protein [Ditylenchus destructor]
MSTLAHTIQTTTPFVGRCPPDAVDCYRILTAWEIVTLSIAVIAFIFQIALFNFVIRQVMSRHEYFSSSFYKLFCVLSSIEILHGIQDSFYQRVYNYGLFLDVFEGNEALCRIDYFLSGYFSYFQCFAHLIIATNRFTVFVFPLRYKSIWKRKLLIYAVIVNALLPLPFLSFRIPAKAIYYYDGPDQLGIKYTDKTVGFYAGLTSASISVFTSLASAILEFSALIAFRKHARQFPISQENWNNLRLLGCTILMLISQALLTAYHCCMMYGNLFNVPSAIDFAQMNVSWVFDQFCFNSSICLFISSSDVRRSFLKFYKLYREKSSIIEVTTMTTTIEPLRAGNSSSGGRIRFGLSSSRVEVTKPTLAVLRFLFLQAPQALVRVVFLFLSLRLRPCSQASSYFLRSFAEGSPTISDPDFMFLASNYVREMANTHW